MIPASRRALACLSLAVGLSVALSGVSAAHAQGQSGEASKTLKVDHYVRVASDAPSMEGQTALIYVRERALPGPVLRARRFADRVVLFVHGAGTPAEVAFDAPGASWMAFLAEAGYDVFSMDMTGYGRSTRPPAMNDPCNLSEDQQAELLATMLTPCQPSHGFAATTIESDWNDLDAVVDYVRALRGVERVHLVGWSLGGPRAGGYAARHPEKVETAILLSPAYSRTRPSAPPTQVPAPGAAMTKQSESDFVTLWDGQLGCADQFEPAVRQSVWEAMLESDPVGATWGTGVRRAPTVTTWGWGRDEVSRQSTPMLLVSPETDGQVAPERVTELYQDLGSTIKVLVHLACSSHNAMWEANRHLLFRASLSWLRDRTVDGVASGEVRLER